MIKTIKEKICSLPLGKLFPYVLILYFLICSLPYITVPLTPIYSFVLRTPIKITIRAVTSLIFVGFALLVYIKEKPKFNKYYLLFSTVLLVLIILSAIITPKSYSTILTNASYAYHTLTIFEVGVIDLLSGLASNIIDLIFGYIFLFILPAVSDKQTIKKFIFFVFFVCLFEVLYSLIFEGEKYIRTIKGDNSSYNGYDINICATFVSKNQFGAFLVMGFIANFFVLKWYTNKKWVKCFLLLSLLVFSFIIIFSLCKTSIFSILLFLIVYFIIYVVGLFRIKKWSILVPVLGLIFAFIVFVIILETTNLKNISIFGKFNNLLISTFVTGIGERFTTWGISMRVFNSYHIILGYPKGILPYVLLVGTEGNNAVAHNGFIQQILYYGIFGIIFLVSLYLILVRRLLLSKMDPSDRKLYVVSLFAILAFMLTETEVFVLSSSLLVFIFNILFTTIKPVGKEDILNEKTI